MPLVSDAKGHLRQQLAGSLHGLLTDKAHAEWEAYLLKRLCSTGKKAVAQRFQTFCSARSAFAKGNTDQQSNKDAAYREFIGNDPATRLYKLLNEYPGLAKISETLVKNWVGTVGEFLERLNEDLAGLTSQFGSKEFRCPIDDLQVGLSDPHRGGRCVVRVGFPSSATLLYKPRSLVPEANFFTLLERLNGDAPPYALRPARCWDQGTYGWMEDIAPQACMEKGALQAFYWRAGALLALVYLARGVDIHMENLIAAGDQPVLIDLETLWHPQEHIDAGNHPNADSVLRTGFLPQLDPLGGGIYEWSALSHRPASSLHTARHLPVFAGRAYPAPGFLQDILEGFRWVGEWVFEERQLGGEFRSWVQTLAQCRRRRILRSTASYRSVIERMLTPSALSKPKSFTAEWLDELDDIHLSEDEQQSLLQMDVPYIEQTARYGHQQEVTLPVQNIVAFQEQEVMIIDAFAPAANTARS